MTTRDTQVLIVGAGPTGLTLALWLKRLGVDIRIIDMSSGPGETSRAIAVQARTLEFHRQLGIVDDVLAEGIRLKKLTMRRPEGIAAQLPLSDFGKGVTRYPFAFALAQDIHERVLIRHLQEAGIAVERETELVSFADDGAGITATLRKGDETSLMRANYVVGADGAHSAVRHGMKLGFPGGTYEQSFYVADVIGHGSHTSEGLDIVLGAYGFALIIPIRQSGSLRLIGVVPERFEAEPSLTFDMIREDVERESGIKVETVNWFSHYRVHHRVADHFRESHAFIAGDAGHIHSPAGGQGMNTGMGDAVNLAWKLAAVLQGRARPELLDSYEPERIAFAHSLIKGTDQAFRLVAGRSWISDIWRRYVMPTIFARLLKTRIGSRIFFRLISQTRINYRGSALSQGKAGGVEGGDRLPWVDNEGNDNFAPLSWLDWQMHVYGETQAAFASRVAALGFPLNHFPWTDEMAKAGLIRDGAYFVRPDGHVGLVSATQDPQVLEAYVARLGIKPRKGIVEGRVTPF